MYLALGSRDESKHSWCPPTEHRAEGSCPRPHNYDAVWEVLFITNIRKEARETEFLPAGDRWVLVKNAILGEATSKPNPSKNQESAGVSEERRAFQAAGLHWSADGSSWWENLHHRNGQILPSRAFFYSFLGVA